MSHWLLTDRCRPGWQAVLELLSDGVDHREQEIREALRMHAGLADRTIDHHLRSATARGWITRRRGVIRTGPTPPADLLDGAK